jgi:pilus assembly protein CpaB
VPGSFSNVEKVIDRGLVTGVGENEPITENKLAPPDSGAGLPPAIKQGMRAMSVKVNEVIGVAGFVVPGTRVDVLVTIRQEHDSVARVVVSNALVLTAGTRYDENEAKKEGKPIPSTVVTLMVTPADAERIALASNEGQIMLALRNPLDTLPSQTSGVRTGALTASASAETAAPKAVPQVARRVEAAPSPPAPAPLAPPRMVETIKAGKRELELLR